MLPSEFCIPLGPSLARRLEVGAVRAWRGVHGARRVTLPWDRVSERGLPQVFLPELARRGSGWHARRGARRLADLLRLVERASRGAWH